MKTLEQVLMDILAPPTVFKETVMENLFTFEPTLDSTIVPYDLELKNYQ
ncbi:hypothetical protein J7S19_11905 [Corynebacterium pyruviciproducens]|nr:hypothetical protein [Corynebacterium pyruviciproducens]MDH4659287.1 hypothetical protein [Corynebacterium pyruviciproducens]